MRTWFPRGLAFAALMVAIRVVQGVLINAFEAHAGLISACLLAVFIAAVMVWGVLDGRRDARANPDPDRRRDLAITWLGAGLFAGVLSGAVSWLLALVDKALYVSSLPNEVTTFAAFTALLVFVPAVGAVTLGRALVDREHAKLPQHHHGLAALEAGETDVFAAVGAAPESADAAAAGVITDSAPTVSLGEPAAGFTTEEIPAEATEATEAATTAENPDQPAG